MPVNSLLRKLAVKYTCDKTIKILQKKNGLKIHKKRNF